MTAEIITVPIPGEGDDSVARVFPDVDYEARHLSNLIATERAEARLTPSQKREARKQLALFFRLCEDNNEDIDYSQHRAFNPDVTPDGFEGDCSSYPTQGTRWVNRQLRRLFGRNVFQLHDPNGPVEFDGFGWTGTLLATNHAHRVPLWRKFFVGDIAIFGRSFTDTRHATVCRKNGLEADAIFSSHGTQSGPLPTRLRYRPDLIGVYRPRSLL